MSVTSALPPRRPNPVLGQAMPSSGSLQGTMAQPVAPNPSAFPVQAPGFPAGVSIPPDFAAILKSGAFQPEEEKTPGAGRQALDVALGTIGGLLSGDPGALLTSLQDVRKNVEAIKQRNMEARRKATEEKIGFVTKGMEQKRQDRIDAAQARLDTARLEGDKQAIERAQQDLQNEKTRLGAQADRDAAELALTRAELERAKAGLDARDDPDNKRALDALGIYTESLQRFRQQLLSQLSSGAAEPVLKYVDPDTNEVTEIRGIDAIREELNAGLAGVTEYAQAFADPDIQEAIANAFEASIGGVLDRWTEKAATQKAEAERAAAAARPKRQSRKRVPLEEIRSGRRYRGTPSRELTGL